MKSKALGMRIGVIQYCPKFKDPEANFDRVRKLCEAANLAPGKVDILCLPEMALSGYMFDETTISDYLEDPNGGITFKLCVTLATWLQCYVFAGYPERVDPSKEGTESHHQGANSALVVGPDGIPLTNYRKTNLFSVDKSWAKPGTGFALLELPEPYNIRVALGICMDLNVQPPSEWESIEDGPYELASFASDKKADLLILLNAWLASDQDSINEEDAPDTEVLAYWYARLRPLWCPAGGQPVKEISVVICNRCGQEEGTLFAGTSTMFHIAPSRSPFLYGRLTRGEERVAIWDT